MLYFYDNFNEFTTNVSLTLTVLFLLFHRDAG